MTRFAGRTALVTGASKGIGRGIAERLGREGALVAVHYGSDFDGAEQTVRAIEKEGGRALALGADLFEPDAADMVRVRLAEALDRAGADSGLDILVHNAGIGVSNGVEDISAAEYERLFAVNVRAPLFLTQALLPRLRDGGRIVNVSTGLTRIAAPAMLPYAMSKGAVEVLTRGLAAQLGPRSITVNTVMPGMISVERTERQMAENPGLRDWALRLQALPRLGRPGDVADAVAFLASDDARWVTGHLLDATGGSGL